MASSKACREACPEANGQAVLKASGRAIPQATGEATPEANQEACPEATGNATRQTCGQASSRGYPEVGQSKRTELVLVISEKLRATTLRRSLARVRLSHSDSDMRDCPT